MPTGAAFAVTSVSQYSITLSAFWTSQDHSRRRIGSIRMPSGLTFSGGIMPTRLFLRRFEIETVKLVGQSPPFFLYPSEASVAFYQQGATAKLGGLIGAGQSELVPVSHPGAVRKPTPGPNAIY